jgi:UDP-sulfoquinovose synthase
MLVTYGYNTVGIKIPEGYLQVQIPKKQGPQSKSPSDEGNILGSCMICPLLTQFLSEEDDNISMEIYYPPRPGSVYHLTKVLDAQLFEYYNRNNSIRVTDLHQVCCFCTN